jgi:hypothetical protein
VGISVRVTWKLEAYSLADHVEVNHACDIGGIILIRLRQVFCAEETLLFACESSKHDGRLGLVFGENSRELE